MWDYPVELTNDDGTVLVSFPDVPEAHTFGEDNAEALLRARDALETALEFYIDDRKPLPKPSPADGRPTVRPEALTCAKLAVYQAMQETGVRKAELAQRLHWHLPQVDRILNLRHASRLDQVEMALEALGKRIVLSVQDAA
ncbi:MAG: type II toxin-antitoxin system HicB family antitoxin [Magnetococcales bacterium]|nr:type II toxin-antitoxin system HicB family antitoxin [Magnetococcales bacterium]MBF0323308.1 type II toxin-antitoxin system HicB family antitoxin [Magnetococcales bacterium]